MEAIITQEPINLAALRSIASRKAADKLRLKGCTVTLRECLYYFLQCVTEQYGEDLGTIPVAWRESSSMETFGIEARRYSGCAPILDSDGATMGWCSRGCL